MEWFVGITLVFIGVRFLWKALDPSRGMTELERRDLEKTLKTLEDNYNKYGAFIEISERGGWQWKFETQEGKDRFYEDFWNREDVKAVKKLIEDVNESKGKGSFKKNRNNTSTKKVIHVIEDDLC